jgi:tagaturonate epimerase
MTKILTLEKYSLGVGDRFAHQAKAQLRACMMAAEQGVEVIPVWNKFHREHVTIGSEPTTALGVRRQTCSHMKPPLIP